MFSFADNHRSLSWILFLCINLFLLILYSYTFSLLILYSYTFSLLILYSYILIYLYLFYIHKHEFIWTSVLIWVAIVILSSGAILYKKKTFLEFWTDLLCSHFTAHARDIWYWLIHLCDAGFYALIWTLERQRWLNS